MGIKKRKEDSMRVTKSHSESMEAQKSLANKLLASTALRVFCVGCGCKEVQACLTDDGPCEWVIIDWTRERGICSACVVLPIDVLVRKAAAIPPASAIIEARMAL